MDALQQSSNAASFNNSKMVSQNEKEEQAPRSQGQELFIKKKLDQIVHQRHVNFLRNNLFQQYGRNYPLNYKPHYKFQQKWENPNIKKEKKGNFKNPLKFENNMEIILYIFITFCNSLAIWLGTIDIFIFGAKVYWLQQLVLSLAIFSQIIDLAIKIKKMLVFSKNAEPRQLLKIILKQNYVNIFAILLFSMKMNFLYFEQGGVFLVFESTIILLLYHQMSKNYHSIRVINFSQNYEYHFKVADLIITLLMISHIMALILFSSTRAGFEKTWINKYGLQTDKQLIFYIYSFYFAATTVLTVGYGDISPANPLEVVTLTFVQICGIIILAYVINQIGFCLSSLRKKKQILEKDFELVDKLKRYYKLNNDVAQRVNEYLINSNQQAYELTPEEQKGVVNKLNEQLRNEVSFLNHLSIVKSSIFLVCRWSKAMQHAVASKLQHTLFSPNNTIYQPLENQRLYFIKKGVIGVYACNDYMTKLLKTISNCLQKEVSDNCYGYTAALSSRKIRIKAVAKQFTSAYYIDKDKFLQCALQKTPDFQYYHQIKNKFLLAKTAESFELPLFDSNRHHYNPNKYTIIKKFQGSNTKNKRSYIVRRQHGRQIIAASEFSVTKSIKRQINLNSAQLTQQSFRISDTKFILCNRYKNMIIVPNDYSQCDLQNIRREAQGKSQNLLYEKEKQDMVYIEKSQQLPYLFESGKEYENYFSRNNRSNILVKLQKEQFFFSDKAKNAAKTSKRSIKKVNTRQMSHKQKTK